MKDKSYLSAPTRHSFSKTASLAIRQNLLTKELSHLDYGCGKGFDFQELQKRGYDSSGFDPYYFPGTPEPADVVTMSYVINAIADPLERSRSILKAWNLTNKYLIISTNVAAPQEKITPIGTFTKSYTQLEFKAFVESTLEVESTFLAKDKLLIKKPSPPVRSLSLSEVLAECQAIAQSGWIAPWYTSIRGYCPSFNFNSPDKVDSIWPGAIRQLRLQCHKKINGNYLLPNNQRVMTLGNFDNPRVQWALDGLSRRNKIGQLKFHCKEQIFVEEFKGFKDLSFLKNEIICQLEGIGKSGMWIKFWKSKKGIDRDSLSVVPRSVSSREF